MNAKLDDEGVPTDGIAGYQTRRSMQSRRSIDPHHRRSSSSIAYLNGHGDREGLIHSYDLENNQAVGLSNLTEENDEESGLNHAQSERQERTALHTKHNSQI